MLSRDQFKKLSVDIYQALQPVAKKYGIAIQPGNVTYSEIDATMKLKFQANDGVNYEEEKFNQLCRGYGFEPEHYRADVYISGSRMKLVGFNPKAQKYPVLLEADDGKRYKSHAQPVLCQVNEGAML